MVNTRSTGDLYRCLKCVLLCLLSSEAFSSAHLLCSACHTWWYLSTPWPSAHPAGTRLQPLLGRMLGCVLPAGAARDQGTLWTVTFLHSGLDSCIHPGTSTLGHSTADPRCAQSSQSLGLLVTQNLFNKYINLNHLPWVNHSSLEPDSTDVCKMALLDAIYFCIKENNVVWSHKKNYKT